MSQEHKEHESGYQSEPLDLTLVKRTEADERSENDAQKSYTHEKRRKWVNASDFTNYSNIDYSPGSSNDMQVSTGSSTGGYSSSESISKFDGDVKVTLMHPQLWNEFCNVQNEMIINKKGRQLFPTVEVIIDGLMPERFYRASLQIVQTDRMRYRYVDNEWRPHGVALSSSCKKACIHPFSPSKGFLWMESAVVFGKIKLSNGPSFDPNTIPLRSMHRYMMKVNIHLLHQDKQNVENTYSFEFPETNFIAVTAYQNKSVTNLKICYNPFAKGFRFKTPNITDTSVVSKKRKAKFLDDYEDQSTSSCSERKSINTGYSSSTHRDPSSTSKMPFRNVPSLNHNASSFSGNRHSNYEDQSTSSCSERKSIDTGYSSSTHRDPSSTSKMPFLKLPSLNHNASSFSGNRHSNYEDQSTNSYLERKSIATGYYSSTHRDQSSTSKMIV